MKCISCGIEVSSNFVAAIIDNRCPACGNQLMDGSEYQKLFALRKQLLPLGLGLDENTLTKIAAAITSRFELWPKDTAKDDVVVESDQLTTQQQEEGPKIRPIRPKNQKEAEKLVQSKLPHISFDEDEGYADEEPMSPQEEAALIKEFGLDKGDSATAMALLDENPSGFNDPSLMKAIGEHEFDLGEEHSNPLAQDRLERAHALKNTANQFGVKPIKRLR